MTLQLDPGVRRTGSGTVLIGGSPLRIIRLSQPGAAVVDAGNPFGPSASIAADGSVTGGGASGLTGYSILTADNLDSAVEMAKGCPMLDGGGAIEVYETFDAM